MTLPHYNIHFHQPPLEESNTCCGWSHLHLTEIFFRIVKILIIYCAFQTYLRWTSYSCDSHYIVVGSIQGAYALLDFDIIQILSFPEDNWSKVWLSAKMIYLKTNLPLLSFISKCILVGNWFELTSNTSLSFSSSNLDDALQNEKM